MTIPPEYRIDIEVWAGDRLVRRHAWDTRELDGLPAVEVHRRITRRAREDRAIASEWRLPGEPIICVMRDPDGKIPDEVLMDWGEDG